MGWLARLKERTRAKLTRYGLPSAWGKAVGEEVGVSMSTA
jgi:hypothetical protein